MIREAIRESPHEREREGDDREREREKVRDLLSLTPRITVIRDLSIRDTYDA